MKKEKKELELLVDFLSQFFKWKLFEEAIQPAEEAVLKLVCDSLKEDCPWSRCEQFLDETSVLLIRTMGNVFASKILEEWEKIVIEHKNHLALKGIPLE